MKYFKGKSIGYHTSVTLSKAEGAVIWITGLLTLISFIANLFIFDSVWIIVLIDMGNFIVMSIIWLLILFSPKHKEERILNERRYKS